MQSPPLTQNGSRTVALFKRAAKDAKAGAKKVRRACIAFEASISRSEELWTGERER